MPKDVMEDADWPGSRPASDPRARRSRACLLSAGRGLIAEGLWDGASVAGICRRAGLARSSFYEHLSDRDDLLRALVAEALARAPVEQGLMRRAPGQVTVLSWLAWHLRSERMLYRAALQGRCAPGVAAALRRTLLAMLAAEKDALSTLAPDLRAFLAGGILSEARDWLMAEPADPTNDLAARLARVTRVILDGVPVRDASAGSSR